MLAPVAITWHKMHPSDILQYGQVMQLRRLDGIAMPEFTPNYTMALETAEAEVRALISRCEKCNQEFHTDNALRTHQAMAHRESRKKPPVKMRKCLTCSINKSCRWYGQRDSDHQVIGFICHTCYTAKLRAKEKALQEKLAHQGNQCTCMTCRMRTGVLIRA